MRTLLYQIANFSFGFHSRPFFVQLLCASCGFLISRLFLLHGACEFYPFFPGSHGLPPKACAAHLFRRPLAGARSRVLKFTAPAIWEISRMALEEVLAQPDG